jgi:hypothetical protein
MRMDFGRHFAYKHSGAPPGKLSEENKMAKKTLKKSKKIEATKPLIAFKTNTRA